MKTISLVIPVYNEAQRIHKTLKQLKKGFRFQGLKLQEVIFVDDGSQDHIKKKIQQSQLQKSLHVAVKLIAYSSNRGRGFAVRTGALAATGDYVVYTDADFSIPLTNLKKFTPWLEQDYDLLLGSKKKPGAQEYPQRSLARRLVGYGHSILASLILGVFAWDFQGGFKVFSRRLIQEVFPLLKQNRWGFDMEVVFLAKKLGFSTKELAVKWGHVEKGSKVKLLRDIYRALKDMLQIRGDWLAGRYKLILDYGRKTAGRFAFSA